MSCAIHFSHALLRWSPIKLTWTGRWTRRPDVSENTLSCATSFHHVAKVAFICDTFSNSIKRFLLTNDFGISNSAWNDARLLSAGSEWCYEIECIKQTGLNTTMNGKQRFLTKVVLPCVRQKDDIGGGKIWCGKRTPQRYVKYGKMVVLCPYCLIITTSGWSLYIYFTHTDTHTHA